MRNSALGYFGAMCTLKTARQDTRKQQRESVIIT